MASGIEGFTEQTMKEVLVDVFDRGFTVVVGEQEYELVTHMESEGLLINLVDPEADEVKASYRLRGPRLS